MKNKLFLCVIFCGCAIISMAQFNPGARLLSGNLTADIQNTSTNYQDLDGLKTKKIDQNNSIGAGIELGYGKITKPNQANIFGLGYSNSQSIKTTNQTDSLKEFVYKDESNINNYYLFAQKNTFIPVKTNWGFMGNLNGKLQLQNSLFNNTNQTKYIPKDSTTYGFSNSTFNTYSANLQINIGAYYLFHKNFILFTQLNLLGVALSYSNTDYKTKTQNSNSDSYTFNFSGVLTPTYKLGDFSIGLKYIIAAKN